MLLLLQKELHPNTTKISVKNYKNLGQPAVGKKWSFPKNKEKIRRYTYIEPHTMFSIFIQRSLYVRVNRALRNSVHGQSKE